MILVLTGEASAVSAELRDAENLGALELRLGPGLEVGEGTVLLDGAVRFSSPEQGWLEQAWLRALGGFDADPERGRGFDGMVAYASGHGWVDEEGRIGVHVAAVEDER
ncbi:MAG TPA: hypothetical protein VGI73_03410 [Solirubrobacterales bacterium]